MSGEAQLEALLEIINISARQAISEYKKGGRGEVPTIHSQTYHPLDLTDNTLALKKALRFLEGACQQLCASLAPPQHTLYNYVTSFESACVGVVVRAKVADALEHYPKGLHVDELAKRVGLEEGKLARMLRLLTTKGCFTEVEPNIFANNRISLATVSTSNTGAVARFMTDHLPRGVVVLYETMTNPDYMTSYHPDMAPLIFALRKEGLKGNFFDVLNPEQREELQSTMIGLNSVSGSLSVLHQYPWTRVKTVCDVGAGIGGVSIPLSKMYPHLKIINQDLPEVMAQAKDVWVKEAPETLRRNQVEFVPFNFFEQSPVEGQDIYYLRHIIHDWPDAEATAILKSVRKVMASHSRLLIHDYALSHSCRDPNAKPLCLDHVAPEPMLPNFGHGNNIIYQMDLTLLILLNSCERTLGHLIALASGAGLYLGKLYDLGVTGVLEFRVATDNTQKSAIESKNL